MEIYRLYNIKGKKRIPLPVGFLSFEDVRECIRLYSERNLIFKKEKFNATKAWKMCDRGKEYMSIHRYNWYMFNVVAKSAVRRYDKNVKGDN